MKDVHAFLGTMALMLVSANAWAGYTETHPVSITANGNICHAEGSVKAARHSSDNAQFIGCMMKWGPNGAGGWTMRTECRAYDSAVPQQICDCTWTDLQASSLVPAINESSFISFDCYGSQGWNLSVYNSSAFLP